MLNKLNELGIGDKIYFLEANPDTYTIRAKKDKYIVATVPGAEKGIDYTIIDTELLICGPHDRTFNFYDFNKDEELEKLIDDLIIKKHGITLSGRRSASVALVLNIPKTLEQAELYKEVLRFLEVVHKSKEWYVSVPLIQRRFRIGFYTAARIIDRMVEEGYVTEFKSSSPRDILKYVNEKGEVVNV